MTDFHRLSAEAVFEALDCGPGGLTRAGSDARIRRFGYNELVVRRRVPEIVKFLRELKNFFALLLIGGGGLALFAEWLNPGDGNLYIAIALFAVVLLNATFTYLQGRQSERIMQGFRQMLPDMVAVLRDGRIRQMEARYLVPGDIMILREGDRVPADGRLIEAARLKVDNSSLTGESEPQRLDPDAFHENEMESRNMVFSGSLVESGDARAVVVRTGMDTRIGSIVELTKETGEVETPIHRELRHFIRIISAIAIVLGVLFFAVSLAIGKGEIGSLIFAIGIIVANVPEGLLPTVTLALTMASRRMAKKNALIKNLESVETLGSTTVICTDKTGTLTMNRLSVNDLWLAGSSFRPESEELARSAALPGTLECMARCNTAWRDDGGFTGDATEVALLAFADGRGDIDALRQAPQIAEEPFDSGAKFMATVVEREDGPCAYLKGAPEVVLARCDRIMLDGGEQPLDDAGRERAMDAYRAMAGKGERGLALAWRPQSGEDIPEDGYVFLALVGMIDPPRPEAPEALAKCRSAGIRVIMVTGDYGLTAETIGRQIGLFTDGGRVVQGDELAAMDDDALKALLQAEPELIFARIAPEQKLKVVRALQDLGETVTVTGDGVNDAPALKNADMGVAMGVNGTVVAQEAAKMVLMDDNFATIVAAVEEGRTIFDNIKKFIAYILTSNIPEILPFIAFVLIDAPLALTVVLILAIDLGTDLLPALGLGAEKPESDVMKNRPRPRGERLLTRNLLFMSYGVVGMIQAAAGFFSFFVILYDGGWRWGVDLAWDDPLYRTAVTGFFASIIICQTADVLICRTRRQSIFTVGLFSNRLVWVGIGTELLLLALIAYVPAFNTFFGTAPLEVWQLALSVPFAILILLGDEVRRLFVRRGNRFVLRWLTW